MQKSGGAMSQRVAIEAVLARTRDLPALSFGLTRPVMDSDSRAHPILALAALSMADEDCRAAVASFLDESTDPSSKSLAVHTLLRQMRKMGTARHLPERDLRSLVESAYRLIEIHLSGSLAQAALGLETLYSDGDTDAVVRWVWDRADWCLLTDLLALHYQLQEGALAGEVERAILYKLVQESRKARPADLNGATGLGRPRRVLLCLVLAAHDLPLALSLLKDIEDRRWRNVAACYLAEQTARADLSLSLEMLEQIEDPYEKEVAVFKIAGLVGTRHPELLVRVHEIANHLDQRFNAFKTDSLLFAATDYIAQVDGGLAIDLVGRIRDAAFEARMSAVGSRVSTPEEMHELATRARRAREHLFGESPRALAFEALGAKLNPPLWQELETALTACTRVEEESLTRARAANAFLSQLVYRPEAHPDSARSAAAFLGRSLDGIDNPALLNREVVRGISALIMLSERHKRSYLAEMRAIANRISNRIWACYLEPVLQMWLLLRGYSDFGSLYLDTYSPMKTGNTVLIGYGYSTEMTTVDDGKELGAVKRIGMLLDAAEALLP